MHITQVEFWPVTFRLSEPYTIAYETVDSAVNVFLRLHTSTGLVGHGCAAPDGVVTGETADEVVAALENIPRPLLVGLDPTSHAAIYRRLQAEMGFRPSTLAALDMAIWDLLGQVANLPLCSLLGGSKDKIRTSVTIGILDDKDTVAQARHWVNRGFSSLKLKGGLNVEEDIQRVRKVREAVGPEVQLAFDANQGYSVTGAVKLAAALEPVGLAFLEQPTARDEPGRLGDVQRRSRIPIMADESLTTPGQALLLATLGQVQLFNVKLMKVGGISQALAIDGIATGAGIGEMVGCLDEAGLAIAAGLHFALGRPNVVYADLDGHFSLENDPTAGAVICRDGFLMCSGKPGLGFALNP